MLLGRAVQSGLKMIVIFRMYHNTHYRSRQWFTNANFTVIQLLNSGQKNDASAISQKAHQAQTGLETHRCEINQGVIIPAVLSSRSVFNLPVESHLCSCGSPVCWRFAWSKHETWSCRGVGPELGPEPHHVGVMFPRWATLSDESWDVSEGFTARDEASCYGVCLVHNSLVVSFIPADIFPH